MRSGRTASARRAGEGFPEPWVVGVDEFVSVSVEDPPPFIQDKKLGAVVDTAIGNRLYFSCLRVEMVSGQKEGVLQAVGDQQRCGVADVALLDNKVDDCG